MACLNFDYAMIPDSCKLYPRLVGQRVDVQRPLISISADA
jgi:hypothetical protein